MTVLVIGGGAVGTLLAWALRSAGHGVTFVRRGIGGRDADFIHVIRPDGRRDAVDVVVIGRPQDLAQPPDVVVLAVKMYDLGTALDEWAAWPTAATVTVQNGIGAEDLVVSRRPGAPIIAASLTAAVEPSADGAVAWLRRGGIGLAAVDGPVGPLTTDLAEAFSGVGLPGRVFDHPAAMKWSKLLGNLVANATAAILDLDVGAVYRHPGLYRLERAQIAEALAVMERLGLRPVPLPGADVRLLIRAFRLPDAVARPILSRVLAGARGGKDPSLLMHVRSRGGRSEVEWMNGAVARVGDAHDVAVPINRRLTELVDEVSHDPDRRAWFRHHPDRLLEAIRDRSD